MDAGPRGTSITSSKPTEPFYLSWHNGNSISASENPKKILSKCGHWSSLSNVSPCSMFKWVSFMFNAYILTHYLVAPVWNQGCEYFPRLAHQTHILLVCMFFLSTCWQLLQFARAVTPEGAYALQRGRRKNKRISRRFAKAFMCWSYSFFFSNVLMLECFPHI